ncbi:MAG: UDP-N-acetylglucosamine pyrophosphorylase, partial [bacterium]
GVVVRCPESVDVDLSVDPARVAPGVVIHAGCRLSGKATSIGPGCQVGREAPATLENCRLADDVTISGGFFSGAIFMSGSSFGSCAHVRGPVVLEEYASCAHSVGLKQTFLMPHVVLGSLINFCDCLMAGGTDRKNHSEVGSGYIHFNYTPHQDKATASLIGDVPRGVMLGQRPIFLGGQGGLIGPARIEYGTVVAAGTICRRDVLKPGNLVLGDRARSVHEIPYDPCVIGDVSRILANNLVYIGNLHALLQWYRLVRPLYTRGNPAAEACVDGGVDAIGQMVEERVARLGGLVEKVKASLGVSGLEPAQGSAGPTRQGQAEFVKRWPHLEAALAGAVNAGGDSALADNFLAAAQKACRGLSYVDGIKALPAGAKQAGTAWLQSIVNSVVAL